MSHLQFHCIKVFILRHAWLNLWDKHMTTGRINQVTFFFSKRTREKPFLVGRSNPSQPKRNKTTRPHALIPMARSPEYRSLFGSLIFKKRFCCILWEEHSQTFLLAGRKALPLPCERDLFLDLGLSLPVFCFPSRVRARNGWTRLNTSAEWSIKPTLRIELPQVTPSFQHDPALCCKDPQG